MTANAIVSGTFSDFKLVKTRSVAQLVIEIPIERAADAVAIFGIPQPGQEIAVAVARLIESPAHATAGKRVPSGGSVTDGTPRRDAAKSARAKAAFAALPSMKQDVTRAAMLIKDKAFQDWIADYAFDIIDTSQIERTHSADACLKHELGIASKLEIGKDANVNARFRKLVATFEQETGRMAEQRA